MMKTLLIAALALGTLGTIVGPPGQEPIGQQFSAQNSTRSHPVAPAGGGQVHHVASIPSGTAAPVMMLYR
jgi:hypothetical protein